MVSSRDSSLLRNLAVAFGDGLAFGVGMKLSQRAAANSARGEPAAEAPDLEPLLERLADLEKRVAEAARAPVVKAIAAAPAPFDQKVLEAVVAALDARLHEQADHTETRLTELEAKLAIELKSLQQQDHTVATDLLSNLEELNANFNDQIAEMRRRVENDRKMIRSEIVAMHREFAEEAAQAVETRVEEAVARHAAYLREELAYKDDQIAELREVIFGFAEACRILTEHPAARKRSEPAIDPAPTAGLNGTH
jgi:hypothetical protein